jgi:hypothetical protein
VLRGEKGQLEALNRAININLPSKKRLAKIT